MNLSQNALKLDYTNVEFKKTDIPDLRFKGEKGMEGTGGMTERGGGRPVGGSRLGVKAITCKAKAKAKDLASEAKAKAKDLAFKAKAKNLTF